jgi:hypothetical protein
VSVVEERNDVVTVERAAHAPGLFECRRVERVAQTRDGAVAGDRIGGFHLKGGSVSLPSNPLTLHQPSNVLERSEIPVAYAGTSVLASFQAPRLAFGVGTTGEMSGHAALFVAVNNTIDGEAVPLAAAVGGAPPCVIAALLTTINVGGEFEAKAFTLTLGKEVSKGVYRNTAAWYTPENPICAKAAKDVTG